MTIRANYVIHNPMLWAIIEFLVFLLICTGWFLLFHFALATRFTTLFPVSPHAFYLAFIMTLIVCLVNCYARYTRYLKIEELSDERLLSDQERAFRDNSKLNLIIMREAKSGTGFKGFAIFSVYSFLVGCPWLLWGNYWWFGLIPFAILEWNLLALLRYSTSFIVDTRKDRRNYFGSESLAIVKTK